jgi:hypothetical protein
VRVIAGGWWGGLADIVAAARCLPSHNRGKVKSGRLFQENCVQSKQTGAHRVKSRQLKRGMFGPARVCLQEDYLHVSCVNATRFSDTYVQG